MTDWNVKTLRTFKQLCRLSATAMILGNVSNEGHVMLPYVFPQGLRVNSAVCNDVLVKVIKPVV